MFHSERDPLDAGGVARGAMIRVFPINYFIYLSLYRFSKTRIMASTKNPCMVHIVYALQYGFSYDAKGFYLH